MAGAIYATDGHLGVDPQARSSTASFQPQTQIRANGGRILMYAQASGAVSANSLVSITEVGSNYTVTFTSVAVWANATTAVGWQNTSTAFGASNYGWIFKRDIFVVGLN